MRIAVMLILLVVAYPLSVSARHGQFPQWVNKATDGQGESCCGQIDCIPAQTALILDEIGGRAFAYVDGATGFIPSYSAVRVSCPAEDPRPYVCFRIGHEHMVKDKNDVAQILITPDAIKCLLIPQCGDDNS